MDARERRKKRAEWPVRKFCLGEEPPENLTSTTSAEERIAMMWSLAIDAWSLTGRSLPDYDRSRIPARLYRPGETPPDDDGDAS